MTNKALKSEILNNFPSCTGCMKDLAKRDKRHQNWSKEHFWGYYIEPFLEEMRNAGWRSGYMQGKEDVAEQDEIQEDNTSMEEKLESLDQLKQND